MSKCPKCGNELGDWTFCNKCGTNVEEYLSTSRSDVSVSQGQIRKCPKCGNEIGEWTFCNKCGTNIEEYVVPEPDKPFVNSVANGQDILNQVSSNSSNSRNDERSPSPTSNSSENVVPPSFYNHRNQNTVPKRPDVRSENQVPKKEPRKNTKTPLVIAVSISGVLLVAVVILVVALLNKPQKPDVISNDINSYYSENSPISNHSESESSSQEEKTESLSAQVEYETVKTIENASYFKSASASSVLPDQAGHQYSAANVLRNDGTCWCENASNYGEGEWIKLELPSLQKVSGLRIVNGYAGTEKQYDYNSKISEIRLDFSDGSSTNVNLKVFGTSERKSIQNISLSQPIETEYVKITIVSVTKGDCEDTCLTFVEPY